MVTTATEKYKQAHKEVRLLRQQVTANTGDNMQDIDPELGRVLEAKLEKAKRKLLRLSPPARDTRGDMYLRAYA